MSRTSWNDTQLCRIMTGWPLSDLDQLGDEAFYANQQRLVDFNLDAKRLVGEIAEAGAEVFYFHAKSHSGNVWFNSRRARKFSALGERDLVGEIVRECRKRGMSTVCMFQVVCDRRAHDEHPEWRQLNSNDEPCDVSPRVCFNNPEYREYILGLIAEVTANYDINAVMLDELDFNGRYGGGQMCYCEHCQRLFGETVGGELPRTPDWDSRRWKSFVRWRFDSLTQFVRDVRRTVKTIKPEVLLTIVSYSGKYLPWTRLQPVESFCRYVDYFSLDISGDIHLSAYCGFFRAYSNVKAEIISQVTPALGHALKEATMPARSNALSMAQAMTIVANNLSWNMDICYAPLPEHRALSNGVLGPYATLAGEIKRRREWLTGKQQSLADVALFYSEDSKVFYGRDDVALYANEFMGYFKALLENQILFDIVGDKHLSADGLQQYRVLVMPNAVCLSATQIDAVRNFVGRGGALVASYKTSLFDEDGDVRDDFALADVLGVSFRADGPEPDFLLRNEFARARAGDLEYGFFKMLPGAGLDRGMDELSALWAPVALVTPTPGTVMAGEFYHRKESVSNHIPGYKKNYIPGNAECLAALVMTSGARVAYLSAKFGALYVETGFRYAERAIVNTVLWALGDAQTIRITAPPCIEATAFRQNDERIIIHFVNYQSVPVRGEFGGTVGVGFYEPEEMLPVNGITVEIALGQEQRIGRAYVAPENSEIELEALSDGRLKAIFPEVKYHSMLVLELR